MVKTLALTERNIVDFVTEANDVIKRDHRAWLELVNNVRFSSPVKVQSNPESETYVQEQLEIWKVISGRDQYDPEDCERDNNVTMVTSVQKLYPYISGNSKESGNYFMGCANILRHINLPPGAKILEFGVGWGHTTRMMSNFGYDVTATDIESQFLDLLDPFSLPGGTPIQKKNSSFEALHIPDNSLDAAIFFECFHHSLAHVNLLKKVQMGLASGGKILFAAEPFYDDWYESPWNVRLDGHSVWAIRNFGWMELGFKKSYISQLLEAMGFQLEWSSIPEIGAFGEMLVATKA